jgi:hypothetical protein
MNRVLSIVGLAAVLGTFVSAFAAQPHLAGLAKLGSCTGSFKPTAITAPDEGSSGAPVSPFR